MDHGHHHARGLYVCLLGCRSLCRFRYAGVLCIGSHLRIGRVEVGQKHNQTTQEMPITHVKRSLLLPSLFLFLTAWGVLYLILSNLTNSTVPVLDSFGNALSFIGLWWLARKYLEQWWIWVVVDAELSALYVYKGIPFTAGLYALYVVIAIAGFFKWRKMMHQPQKPTRP